MIYQCERAIQSLEAAAKHLMSASEELSKSRPGEQDDYYYNVTSADDKLRETLEALTPITLPPEWDVVQKMREYVFLHFVAPHPWEIHQDSIPVLQAISGDALAYADYVRGKCTAGEWPDPHIF